MIQSASVDGNVLHNPAVGATGVQLTKVPAGLFGTPEMRDVSAPMPDDDGIIELSEHLQPRAITLQGYLYQPGDWSGFFAKLDALKRWLAPGDRQFDFTLQDGSHRRCVGRVVGGVDVDEGDMTTRPFVEWQAQVRCADPLLYGAALRSVTFNPLTSTAGGLTWPLRWPLVFQATGADGAVQVTNEGSASAKPLWQITGPWTDPWLENMTTGVRFYTEGLVLGASDVLQVDAAARTVRVNGVERPSVVDWGRSKDGLPKLRTGTNALRAGGSFAAGATMTVQTYDAFL